MQPLVWIYTENLCMCICVCILLIYTIPCNVRSENQWMFLMLTDSKMACEAPLYYQEQSKQWYTVVYFAFSFLYSKDYRTGNPSNVSQALLWRCQNKFLNQRTFFRECLMWNQFPIENFRMTWEQSSSLSKVFFLCKNVRKH